MKALEELKAVDVRTVNREELVDIRDVENDPEQPKEERIKSFIRQIKNPYCFNIVYDFYSKDLSVKVKTAKRAKMKQGEYIGGHVPYGLLRDPGDYHKLVADPEAAAVVREIFDAAISGARIIDIARMLNGKGYETSARYFQRKNPDKRKFCNTSALACWDHTSVRRILQQEMYYGAVVGHKREGVDVGWKHSVSVAKEKQLIVEGMHQGIVTKEEFMEAQKIFQKHGKTRRVVEKTYPLWRKVRCGACGRAMSMKSGIVWEAVKELLAAAGDGKKRILKGREEAEKNNAAMVKKLAKLQREKEKCEGERFANMDQFMAGNLEKDVYQKRRAEFTKEAERLDGLIAELEAGLHEAQVVRDDGVKEAVETMERYSGAEEIDQKIVDALIEKVLVYDPEHIEIRWKFSDEVLGVLGK